MGVCCNCWFGGFGYVCVCILWKLLVKCILISDVIIFIVECNVKDVMYKDGDFFYIF